ncbi:MAG: hypothetical protein ABSG65_05390 [Bryobacteraceae bacterium]|jgi:hypothetical protein
MLAKLADPLRIAHLIADPYKQKIVPQADREEIPFSADLVRACGHSGLQ